MCPAHGIVFSHVPSCPPQPTHPSQPTTVHELQREDDCFKMLCVDGRGLARIFVPHYCGHLDLMPSPGSFTPWLPVQGAVR